MEPFATLESSAVVLDISNVDTDQIIPSRFMRTPRSEGYGGFLFHDLRFDAEGRPIAGFPLNSKTAHDAQILIGGENFGCGSSREAAIYALADFGIRCVVAPSFGDIFRNNAFKNGLLTVTFPKATLAALIKAVQDDGIPVSVDLAQQRIACGTFAARFDVEAYWKECLLEGADDIDLTLRERGRIDEFCARRMAAVAWLVPPRVK